MLKSKVKPIPEFKSEDEERKFWSTHDVVDYFDMYHPVEFDLSALKPTSETISLRMPSYLLARIKEMANAMDVPYQSLMKVFLKEKVDEKLKTLPK